jgi:hypothetical protein
MRAFVEYMMLEEVDGRPLSGTQAAENARQRLYDEGWLSDFELYRHHDSRLDMPPWDNSVEPRWLEKVSDDYLKAIERMKKNLQRLDEDYEMGLLAEDRYFDERQRLFYEGYDHLNQEVAEQRLTDDAGKAHILFTLYKDARDPIWQKRT